MKGLIFDIKHFAIHDGPGIRTTVFMQGCPLHCRWCHNPESQPLQGCIIRRSDKLGDRCFDHDDQVGYQIDSSDLMQTLRGDTIFYEESGGGVTFSGGEPMMQPQFLVEMLSLCRSEGIGTAVDTSGAVSSKWWGEVARLTDHFLFDVKSADPDIFATFVGGGFEPVERNLALLSASDCRITVRVPVVEGVNNGKESFGAILALVERAAPNADVELLPFHRTGVDKYARLGRDYPMGDMCSMKAEELQPLKELVRGSRLKLVE